MLLVKNIKMRHKKLLLNQRTNKYMYICMYVRVCMCVKKNERKKVKTEKYIKICEKYIVYKKILVLV